MKCYSESPQVLEQLDSKPVRNFSLFNYQYYVEISHLPSFLLSLDHKITLYILHTKINKTKTTKKRKYLPRCLTFLECHYFFWCVLRGEGEKLWLGCHGCGVNACKGWEDMSKQKRIYDTQTVQYNHDSMLRTKNHFLGRGREDEGGRTDSRNREHD